MTDYKDATKRVDLVVFNHNEQVGQTYYVDDDSELEEFLADFKGVELTLEQLSIDGTEFPFKKGLESLGRKLAEILEAVDTYDVDLVADFVGIFGVDFLDNIEQHHTGCADFTSFCREQADEMLHGFPDEVTRYFDYAAYERDLAHSYNVGAYVWNQ